MQSNDENPDSSDTEANISSKCQENKTQSMTEAETFMLLDLIAKSQILRYKSTKSAVNELKNQEWKKISKLFNSRTKLPRSEKQIRLKWDNLKKFARQRAKESKPLRHKFVAQVLNIINHPIIFNENQIDNKLLLNIDNFNENSEINNISDELNVDRSGNDEITEGTINRKRKAGQMMKPMTNTETSMLVDLIAKSKILHCKSVKADANKLKFQEWQRISKLFYCRTKLQRTPKQLRIKWDSLKKLAKQQANRPKDVTRPQVNNILGKVLKIIKNPKPFIESKINIEHCGSPETDFWCSNTSNKTLQTNIKNQEKDKSMNKHETNTLLDLIEGSQIFNSAEYFSDKVKRLEWCRICNDFNKIEGVTEARTPKQLCVRWGNMKKASRKQTSTFQPDSVLERVRAILRNRDKSIEQSESDDDNINSDINNYGDTSFSDMETEPEINISDSPESTTNHSINTTDNIKPMSKEETNVLLDLIEKSQVLHNNVINPYPNEIKVKEWDRITDGFNTIVGTDDHTAEQLRSKWENLKVNASKKIALLDANGKSPYEMSDGILDRVSSILEKFEGNESNRSIANEEDPLDVSNETIIKLESEQEVDEDHSSDEEVDEDDHKQVPFSSRETKILVTLVRSNKVICNTRNTVYSHEAKQREWLNIATRFNAIALPEVPRNSRQLFMEWENLKRQARKRNALIKMKNSQIRNAKHDKILDNISSLLDNEAPNANITQNVISTLKPQTSELDKTKAMTDEEIKTFVGLIERSKFIREYKKYDMKVKLIEWQRITKLFNSARTTRTYKSLKQLRLKWENMKKSARKYMSSLAFDKANSLFSVRNELLERVANILQSNKGNIKNKDTDILTIMDEQYITLETDNDNDIQNISLEIKYLNTFLDVIESEIHNIQRIDDPSEFSPEWNFIAEEFSAQTGEWMTAEQLHTDWSILRETAGNLSKNRQMPTEIPQDILDRVSAILHKHTIINDNHETTAEEPQNITFKTEVVDEASEGNSSEDEESTEQPQDVEDSQKAKASSNSLKESRLSRNTAIAEYFVVKKKIAEAKLNKILLENEKLQLEIDLLKSKEK